MTISYNLIVVNGTLDGVTTVDLSLPGQTTFFADAAQDSRAVVIRVENLPIGLIRPRQDIEQVERGLQPNTDQPPMDIINRATASKAQRQGVPLIDDFMLHHLTLRTGDPVTPPTVKVVNVVTNADFEDLTSLLVDVTGLGDWALRECRMIPTGHGLSVAEGAGPQNYRVSAAFDPIDAPTEQAILCAGRAAGGGGDTTCCNPIVADVVREGADPGPYNTVTDPPIILPGGFFGVYRVFAYTQHFDAAGAVFFRTHPNVVFAGPLPTVTGFTFNPGGPTEVDEVDVALDLSGGGTGLIELVFENDCGCRGMILLNLQVA